MSIVPGLTGDEFIFIIDTDKYAGNFERELTAFCTGRIGVCNVGSKESERFFSDTGIHFDSEPFHYIKDTSDRHGAMRPCYICETPHYFYKDEKCEEIFFDEQPTLEGKKNARCSVALMMKERPHEIDINSIQNRAKLFFDSYVENEIDEIVREDFQAKITGFRLLQIRLEAKEVNF